MADDKGHSTSSRSRKIIMLRMASRVTPKTLADLKREVQIAARTGDTSVVLDLQHLTHIDADSFGEFHKTLADSIPMKRVVLFNVSGEIERLLDEARLRGEFDAVVALPLTGMAPPPDDRPLLRPTATPVPPPSPPPPAATSSAAARTPVPPTPKIPPPPLPAPPAAVRPPFPGPAKPAVPASPKAPAPGPGGATVSLVGTDFKGMKVIQEIGKGGLATVYLVEQPASGHRLDQAGTDAQFALKVLHPWYADSKTIVDQFLAEGNLGRRLEHENLVKVYGCGRSGKLHYVLLEYVPSRSVLDLITEVGRIEEPRALAIIADVAAALEYLEGNAVIHGDVKAGNILIANDTGRAKLVDFGTARRLQLDPDRTTPPPDAPGTPGYMDPHRTDAIQTSDPRGEIYSLGVTLYRMVAGIRPGVSGKMPLNPLHPQFLSDNTLSPTVRYFIARMTVLDVQLRYAGAREARKELNKHLVGGRTFTRDMSTFGQEYVETYRGYMRERQSRRGQEEEEQEG